MSSFADLSVHERLCRALDELNIHTPTRVQQEAIPPALEGQDLRVVAQTGSGKTAAFVLPMLQQLMENPQPHGGTRALILLPTRELAQQTLKQVQDLSRYTFIQSELITGGEPFKPQAAKIRKNPEILIGTPGRLLEHLEANNLDLDDLAVLVLDESDRTLDMGLGEEVLRLAAACNAERQTLLFSATAGGSAMDAVIGSVLREPQHLLLDTVRDLNEAIHQQVITADDPAHKERMLQWLLAHESYDKAIIFTNTRERADRLGTVLRACAQKVFVLHGEKTHADRKRAMDRLKNGDVNVLVATDVAARGIDVAGLDLVINFDVPRNGDEYLHRIGRTGRIGGAGLAISLVLAQEWNRMIGIQRYLRQDFEFRIIDALKGHYLGPKARKSSGKSVGNKKKKRPGKKVAAKGKRRPAAKTKGRGRKPALDPKGGLATPKRKGRRDKPVS